MTTEERLECFTRIFGTYTITPATAERSKYRVRISNIEPKYYGMERSGVIAWEGTSIDDVLNRVFAWVKETIPKKVEHKNDNDF